MGLGPPGSLQLLSSERINGLRAKTFAFTSVARPEIFEFCVASGHAKFETFAPLSEREKLCGSAFHPSKTPLLVAFIRLLEGWNALFLEVFARRPLIISHDSKNNEHHQAEDAK